MPYTTFTVCQSTDMFNVLTALFLAPQLVLSSSPRMYQAYLEAQIWVDPVTGYSYTFTLTGTFVFPLHADSGHRTGVLHQYSQ